MKRVLSFIIIALLVVPPALATTSLLRLQRAETPMGPWQEVPANTLPITEVGELQDTFESPTGYYRMEIEPGADWGFPLNIPLEDVPPVAVNIAKSLLNDLPDLDGWEDAVLGPMAFPMYTPGVDGPSYIEFTLLSPQPEPPDLPFETLRGTAPAGEPSPLGYDCLTGTPRGYILVSLTKDDFPIVEYSTEGRSRTECLRKRAKTSAVQIVKYDDEAYAAEDSKGQLLAYHGPPPVYYPDDILECCDQVFEGEGDPQGEKNPEPPPFQGEPYKSYDAFKEDYQKSKRFQEAHKRRREAAAAEWEIIEGQHEEVVNLIVCQETVIFPDQTVAKFELGDASFVTYKIQNQGVLVHATKPGVTTLHVEFVIPGGFESADGFLVASEAALSPDAPTGWSSWQYWNTDDMWAQRCYEQEWGGSCWSGCGATAWALVYGWWDRTGRNTILIDGTAPLYNNNAVRDCTWYVVDRVGTYCVGSSGATNPWNMYKGYRWAQHRGSGWSYQYKWTSPCFGWTWDGPRDLAINTIKDTRRPVIIGTGCSSAHYPVAYRYKYRRYRVWGVTWARQRRFYCNMGWGCSKQWKNADGIWYACKAIF
jgi:hypothetical protein